MAFARTNMLNSPTDRTSACHAFLSKLQQFSEGEVKQVFYKANSCDIPILQKKMNEKVRDIKNRYTRLSSNAIDLTDELESFFKELMTEYDEIGIKETFDKIKKIYNLLEYDVNRREDFDILQEIRKEYIDTKKIPKSTMLYLNKLNRELKIKKEDNDVQRQQKEEAAKHIREHLAKIW